MKCENPYHTNSVVLFGNTATHRVTRDETLLLCSACTSDAFRLQRIGSTMTVQSLRMTPDRKGFDYSAD
jgi:hypothetical protein